MINSLIELIKKDGEEFLNDAVLHEDNIQLSKDDLTDMVILCHLDKHGNSDRATRFTRKIILLRKTT